MRNRTLKVLNVLAFCLLFFALYLNFIYKEDTTEPGILAIRAAAYGSMISDQSKNDAVNNKPYQPADSNKLAYLKKAHIVILTK